MIETSVGVAEKALSLYRERLREQLETPENIGKMVVLDTVTGDYEVDAEGIRANQRLRGRHPGLDSHRLFAIRIGYDAAYAVGGTIELTKP